MPGHRQGSSRRGTTIDRESDHPSPMVSRAAGLLAQRDADLANQRRIGGVTRPAPHPDRGRGARDGHPDDDLRQIIAAVLRLAIGAEPDPTAFVGIADAAGLGSGGVPGGPTGLVPVAPVI